MLSTHTHLSVKILPQKYSKCSIPQKKTQKVSLLERFVCQVERGVYDDFVLEIVEDRPTQTAPSGQVI